MNWTLAECSSTAQAIKGEPHRISSEERRSDLVRKPHCWGGFRKGGGYHRLGDPTQGVRDSSPILGTPALGSAPGNEPPSLIWKPMRHTGGLLKTKTLSWRPGRQTGLLQTQPRRLRTARCLGRPSRTTEVCPRACSTPQLQPLFIQHCSQPRWGLRRTHWGEAGLAHIGGRKLSSPRPNPNQTRDLHCAREKLRTLTFTLSGFTPQQPRPKQRPSLCWGETEVAQVCHSSTSGPHSALSNLGTAITRGRAWLPQGPCSSRGPGPCLPSGRSCHSRREAPAPPQLRLTRL